MGWLIWKIQHLIIVLQKLLKIENVAEKNLNFAELESINWPKIIDKLKMLQKKQFFKQFC